MIATAGQLRQPLTGASRDLVEGGVVDLGARLFDPSLDIAVHGKPAPSMIVVFSLSTVTRLARPRSSSFTESSRMPVSSMMALPPVRIAISSSMDLRRSPKPGAFTAQTMSVPRSLLTTSVASASPSTSSEISSSGLPTRTICSRSGRLPSFMLAIFFSRIRMYGSSRTHSMRSASVTK